MAEWPKRLPGYAWMPARWGRYGNLFATPPGLLIVHSGSIAENVAGYLARVPDGRMVSAHFAWLAKQQRYVQMVDLDRQAWHAGKKHNGRSIGIEMSGPWDQDPRNPKELSKLRKLVVDLTDALPSLTHWARHSDLSGRKKDPGPGLPDELCDGLLRRGAT